MVPGKQWKLKLDSGDVFSATQKFTVKLMEQ